MAPENVFDRKDNIGVVDLSQNTLHTKQEQPLKKDVYVMLEKGIHARPSARIVGVMMKLKDTSAFLCKEGESDKANAIEIVAIMNLCAENGSKITIEAKGPFAHDAISSIERILLGENEEN